MATKQISETTSTAPRVLRGVTKVAALIGCSRRTTRRYYENVDMHGQKHPLGALMFKIGDDLCIDENDYTRYVEERKAEEKQIAATRAKKTARRKALSR